jgi:hypothetical protein
VRKVPEKKGMALCSSASTGEDEDPGKDADDGGFAGTTEPYAAGIRQYCS